MSSFCCRESLIDVKKKKNLYNDAAGQKQTKCLLYSHSKKQTTFAIIFSLELKVTVSTASMLYLSGGHFFSGPNTQMTWNKTNKKIEKKSHKSRLDGSVDWIQPASQQLVLVAFKIAVELLSSNFIRVRYYRLRINY